MFLLFGFKTAVRHLFSVSNTCPYCGQLIAQRVEERATRFTLFFIPLLTTRRRYGITCSNCGGSTVLSKREKEALAR
ncbi:zinc-ribbon domain-containing protein [Arthrobacter sp. HLT1-21]